MARLLSTISIFILICSCRQGPSENQESTPDYRDEVVVDLDFGAIRDRGYITALVDNSSTGLFLYRGETMGYEYELLKMFTDSMGLELKIDVTVNLDQAFEKLNKGEGDIMAYNLTVTKERKKRIAFTHYHNQISQVLVQRMPDNWRDLKYHEIEAALLRNQVDLIGKEVHVRYQSSYFDRLINLSEEIGGEIIIVEDFPDVDTEAIIAKVASGEIDYTVVEENIAMVNSRYYPNLDIKTPISFPQQIAWGVRKNSDSLLYLLNNWIVEMRKTPDYYVVYDKYFRSSKNLSRIFHSDFSSVGGGNISPYDDLFKEYSEQLNWDWRLLAAQVFRESRFDPKAKSWAGAIGLMQVLPRTAQEYGIRNLTDPEQNIKAGVQQIIWLQDLWKEYVVDSIERQKFILASYNVGHGHVFDARKLAEKNNLDRENWAVVSDFLIKKSDPDYYNDPDVRFGYCRGIEPVEYVTQIFQIYDNYCTIQAVTTPNVIGPL